MRLYIILAWVLFLVSLHSYADVLKGVVRENIVGGPPSEGVEVSATGANLTKTKSDGQFLLDFPNKKRGEIVVLSFFKEGYIVVNEVQLEQILPANPDTKPSLILICKPSRYEEMARRFYRLKSNEAIEARYQQLLKKIATPKTEVLAHLQQQRDRARSVADNAAEELAMSKAGQTSELYKRAMRLFLDAKIEEALRILDENQLRRNRAAARQMKDRADKLSEQVAQSWILRAQMFTVQFRFEDAEGAYKEALETAPESYGVNFAYGYFNHRQGRDLEAIAAYEQCLKTALRNNNKANRAQALNNLGILYPTQDREQDAQKSLEDAVVIYTDLAADQPETYSAFLAIALNNLGDFHHNHGDSQGSLSAITRTLAIYKNLAERNPEIYLPWVADTWDRIGLVYMSSFSDNSYENAHRSFEEALNIYRNLKPKIKYQGSVADTLVHLGRLYGANKHIEEARWAYKEALQIYQDLSAQNDDVWITAVSIPRTRDLLERLPKRP